MAQTQMAKIGLIQVSDPDKVLTDIRAIVSGRFSLPDNRLLPFIFDMFEELDELMRQGRIPIEWDNRKEVE